MNSIEFTILHKGSSKDGAKYTIGNLTTQEGKFRVYYYMKANGDSFLIHELSLNKGSTSLRFRENYQYYIAYKKYDSHK